MSLRSLVVCLFLATPIPSLAIGQTTTTSITESTFQRQVQAAVTAGNLVRSIKLSGAAEWTAGSLQESGTAQLEANADGSSNVQLYLNKASRTETQTKADSLRTCHWTDAAGVVRENTGKSCFIAIPWFAPSLIAQSAAQLPAMLMVTDDGEMSKNGASFHQISYGLNFEGMAGPFTKRLQDASVVKVQYDAQSFLPVSLEYSIHPDSGNSQTLEARVVFSDYRSVSGVMLPFHIEKYVNRTLQLKLDVNNASIE